MVNNEKYSCVSDLGAELLMVISALIVTITAWSLSKSEADHEENLFLSTAYTIFLPLMSYLFAQANQYSSDGGAQVILIWMVFIEIIRLRSDPINTWRLQKTGEQLVRLCWVVYLICSYAPLHGIRVSLLVLCIYFGVCVVLRGIIFNKAKDSYLIGKNPKIIHNYVERIMLQDDLHTTPMNICDYIVMGEENHKIDLCSNGYVLGEKKSSSDGILTIGRVFQLNSSEDEAFSLENPKWRDVCLSFALAKMLRRRFAKLPVDEAGCRKSLDFVLEGIIDYIGNNRDIQTDENDGGRNPTRRVFSIIQEELEYISEFLHMTEPIFHYLEAYTMVDWLGISVILGNGIYLIYTICKKSSAWLSLVVEKSYNQCFLHAFRRGSMVVKIFSRLDLAITILLFIACLFIEMYGSLLSATQRYERWKRWVKLDLVKRYIRDPTNTKWNRSQEPPSCLANSTKAPKAPTQNVKKTRHYYSSIVDFETETIFFCIKVDVSTLARLPKWIRRTIPRSSPTVTCSCTDAKEAILKSLRKSDGRLTNGETSLKTHGMDHLNWACQPHASTTETILVWHIATTLLHNHQPSPHQNNDPHQETESQQNNNPFKEKEVALVLSSYCHYLVKCFPDLLPDEVDWTEKIYNIVRKEILDIDQEPTKEYRCNYALHSMWPESSVVGKGTMLAKDLIKCAEDDEAQVWMMLAEFWAEMMLFIAPSDNVDGHEKLLDRGELITQLWALLTHAGIITRPKPTKHQDHQSDSNAVTGDMNV